jgi:hypothetical protein
MGQPAPVSAQSRTVGGLLPGYNGSRLISVRRVLRSAAPTREAMCRHYYMYIRFCSA